jgi:hypothetical protein
MKALQSFSEKIQLFFIFCYIGYSAFTSFMLYSVKGLAGLGTSLLYKRLNTAVNSCTIGTTATIAPRGVHYLKRTFRE